MLIVQVVELPRRRSADVAEGQGLPALVLGKIFRVLFEEMKMAAAVSTLL